MNGKELLMGVGNINPRYYEEAETEGFSTRKRIRRPLLIAAIVALTILLIGCAVVSAYSFLTEFFQKQSVTDLSPEQVAYIEEKEQILDHSVVHDGWTVQVKSSLNDGHTAYILLGITAPEHIDLETSGSTEYYLGEEWDELISNNQQIEVSSSRSGWIEDDDMQSNTMDYMIRWEPDTVNTTKNPFSSNIEWRISFENITCKSENTAYYQELLEGKYSGQEDFMLTSEEMDKLYSKEIVAEGIWDFCFSFEHSNIGLELLSSQITVTACVHRNANEAQPSWEDVTISSFTLNTFSAVIQHQSNGLVNFTDKEGKGVVVVLHNGTEIELYQSNATRNTTELSSAVPIVLSEVSHVRMPDNTIISISD